MCMNLTTFLPTCQVCTLRFVTTSRLMTLHTAELHPAHVLFMSVTAGWGHVRKLLTGRLLQKVMVKTHWHTNLPSPSLLMSIVFLQPMEPMQLWLKQTRRLLTGKQPCMVTTTMQMTSRSTCLATTRARERSRCRMASATETALKAE